MLDRKLYKTKLCVLYQRGHCPRQTCSFAHGNAELRRFSGSFNDRRRHRGSDLREKLERRHSPYQRSPGRDTRGRHSFHGQKVTPYDRGYSRSRSPGRRSERKHRKRQHLDGQSDASGSVKVSESAEDRRKQGKASSYDEKNNLEEQLKQVLLDVEMLDDHKGQLEIALEKNVQEADSLAARVQDLELQLKKEQEDCKRIMSKIKKFVKAHIRFTRAQEELKRTQARLQRLGDQLGSETSRLGGTEEDSSVNIISNGEPNGENQMSPRNEPQNHASPSKKRLRSNLGTSEEKAVTLKRKDGISLGTTKLEKLTRLEGTSQSEHVSKEAVVLNKVLMGNIVRGSMKNDDKHKRGKSGPISIASLDKYEGDDEVVDVEGLDADIGDVDVNSEVEIEQL